MRIAILVPGFAASKLYCECGKYGQQRVRLYPKRTTIPGVGACMHDHLKTCENVSTKPLKSFWNFSIYNKFERELQRQGVDVHFFSYDWRREVTDSAASLARFIRTVMQESSNGTSAVDLVGHSMGGLIIRVMLEYLNVNMNINHVYIFATPFYGSRNVVHYSTGFDLCAFLTSTQFFRSTCPIKKMKKSKIYKLKPFLFTTAETKYLLKNYPQTFLYLLPTPMLVAIVHSLDEGEIECEDENALRKAARVHMTLSEYNFRVPYFHIFEVATMGHSEVVTNYVPMCKAELLPMFSLHNTINRQRRSPNCFASTSSDEQQQHCGFQIRRLMKSDGLVVPYCDASVPFNCQIIFLNEGSSHVRVLNATGAIYLLTKAMQEQDCFINSAFV